MDSLAVAFPVRIPFLFLVLKTMEKKGNPHVEFYPVSNMFFFLIHLLLPWKQTRELLRIRSRLAWIHHIFWVSLYALFLSVLLIIICLFYEKPTRYWLKMSFVTKGNKKGKATLVCWAFVYKMHCLRGIEESKIHSNIFNIFTLCSRIITLLLYVSLQ